MNNELNDLLDATLDDLDDLPSFTPFPAGVHRVTASFEVKEINSKQAIELNFKMLEVIELADPSDLAPKPGDTSNTMFMMSNEYGVGNFKKCALPFGESLSIARLGDIVEQVKDVECIIVTSLRKDKNDPEKFYLNVKEIQVV